MGLSPMMGQYLEVKEQYPDALVFFRLGDFYEMFFEDAKTASKALDLTLTGRDCGQEERAPMCGVPFHKSDLYISRLVDRDGSGNLNRVFHMQNIHTELLSCAGYSCP